MPSLIRLYLDQPLAEGQTLALDPAQSHYVANVMRRGAGAPVEVFNGRDGAWAAEIVEARKKAVTLRALRQVAPQRMPPDLWLFFAPIKKARTDFIVEKAAELGAARIVPVQTDHTNSERVRRDRLQAHAVEAAEQCGGTYVPEVAEMAPLSAILDDWPDGRQLMFCDETAAGRSTAAEDLGQAGPGPWAIVIGPEGGFSEAERKRLRGMEAAVPVALGPRILRADTAAVAAITVWQQALGDWR
ncbi:16S rRNA (uracil(1498)-N(3))-methyltransferase [Palleronia sediminis]|uniref:Ribosomal RNA small subunit methyltransferase E n=1 Tax=Palleronia sediminis TaxID=2547833 RepID=A0A4R5ZY82_9RHOB|nr:16S rRNA (uracil(1498)-N(3))-methyltransferase [Palleronia sediminis]TDL75214.1 16S rRNA (uracil(1498)-N(3))-methyltransferase [Palleronia sediminis]